MAKPSDLSGDMSQAAQDAQRLRENDPDTYSKRTKEYHAQRRVEAMSLRMAGLTYQQIGDRLGITLEGAYKMVKRSFNTVESDTVEEMRELENDRLDRAQAAIWPKVLKGDEKAIGTFLRISSQRSRINGLDSPTKIDISVGVRNEMETALNQLEELVMEAEVVEDAEVVNDDSEDSGIGQKAITAEVEDENDGVSDED